MKLESPTFSTHAKTQSKLNVRNNLVLHNLISKTYQPRSQYQTNNNNNFRNKDFLAKIPTGNLRNTIFRIISFIFQADFSIYNSDNRDQNNQNQKTDDGIIYLLSHSLVFGF